MIIFNKKSCVLINHFYTFGEADFRYGLLDLLLTLRFRKDKPFVADASLSHRARLPAGKRSIISAKLKLGQTGSESG